MERPACAKLGPSLCVSLLVVAPQIGCADSPQAADTDSPPASCVYSIKPVWRSDSLPPGVYLGTSGHGGYDCPGTQCGMDLVGLRFDPSEQAWAMLKNSADAPISGGINATPHSEYLGWEMPFYSPVDGEVIACWRNIPEEEDDNAEPAACLSRPGGKCVGGGNQLWIRTRDDKVVFMGHLRLGSIPEALCPIPDDTPLAGISGSGVTCSIGSPWTRMRRDINLDNFVTERPIVKAGDFVGRMGSSGNSGNPHLHLGVYDYWEDPNSGEACYADHPYVLRESWSQRILTGVDRDLFKWERRECEVLVFGGDPRARHIILPDPVGPRMAQVALGAGSSPALALTPGGGVAVYRNSLDVLEAQGFTFDGDGAFDFGARSTDNRVLAVDVAPIAATADHVVAAARDDSGLLRLVPFYMETDGDLIKGAPKTEAPVTAQLVAVTRAPTHEGVVVAVKNASHALTVIDYSAATSGSTISLTRSDAKSTTHDVFEIDIATVNLGRDVLETTGQWQGVVTAERDASDVVWLRTWTVSAKGALTAVDSEAARDFIADAAYTVSDLDLTVIGGDAAREFFVLSTILSTSGMMRVSAYSVASDGSFSLVDQFDADDVTDAAVSSLCSARSGPQDMLVGTRLAAGGSTLWSFNVSSTGELRRIGGVDTETVSALVVGGRADDKDMVGLTASSGTLSMTHHRTNYAWLR